MNINQLTVLLFLIFQILACTNQTKHTDFEKANSTQFTTLDTLPVNKIVANTRNPLLLSRDYGQTWVNVSQGLPTGVQVSFIETKENEMVIATDNMGVFISTNNRSQWKRAGTNLPGQKINALHVVEKTIFVGVYRKGIFKSDDEGVTWDSINDNLPNLSVQTIWKFEEELFVGTDAGIFKLSNLNNS